MRKLKRLASVLLALVMCFGLTVTAFADDTYTITINNSTSGYQYTAYQIFTVDSSYVAQDWGSNVNSTTAVNGKTLYQALAEIEDSNGDNPFTDADGDPLTDFFGFVMIFDTYTDEDPVVQAFAEVIKSYITGTGTTSTDTAASSGTYTINVSATGYYLVETTGLPATGYSQAENGAYTRYILTVVKDTGAEANTKSSVPTIDKDLSDVDANISDTITYYLTATLPSTYDDYDTYKLVFNDTLSKGLTFVDGSVEVYVYTTGTDYAYDKDVSDGTQVRTDDYTVSSLTENSDGGHSFTVTLTDTKALTSTSGSSISTTSASRIVVTFKAKLNSDAVIGGAGNPNEVYLEYSNNPNDSGTGNNNTGTTPEDKVVTWTYTLNVTKVDSSTNAGLEDAEFILYRLNSNNEEEYVVLTDGKVSGWTTTETSGSTLTSDADGLFSVIGLDVGTYYLREVTPPSGYKTLADDIELVIAATYSRTDSGTPTNDDITLNTLTITADSTPGSSSTSSGTVSTTVANSTIGSLPSTGGIGTTIFYVVGGVLVAGAVVLLITRKRMKDGQ